MEQLAQPIRRLLARPKMFSGKEYNEPTVRMSEINKSPSQSFNLSENLKNVSKIMLKSVETGNNTSIQLNEEILNAPEAEENLKTPATEVFTQELNDLDFKKFVDDLALNAVDTPKVDTEWKGPRHPVGRIIYERTEQKETIVIDSIPNRDSDDIQVIKVRIMLPKDRQGCALSLPITNCTSTFKRTKLSSFRAIDRNHHLPIMGKAALLRKYKQSAHVENNDSEIIKDLVIHRFQDCLLNYYEKSFQRQTSRNFTNCTDVNLDATENKNTDINSFQDEGQDVIDTTFSGISSIASESVLSISTTHSEEVQKDTEVETARSTCSRQSRASRASIESFRASTACSNHTQNDVESRKSSRRPSSEDCYHFDGVGCLTDDMKFLLSTDTMNVETSHEVTSTVSCSPQSEQSHKSPASKFGGNETMLLDYDASQFLKDALGDELNNYYSTDASYMNSIGTSNISALVSKADTQEYSSTIYENSVQISEYEYQDYYPSNKRVSELLAESNVQYQVISQTAKALTFCRNTKEFSAGNEELEAERILLTATCKRDAIREEIHRLEYEDYHNLDLVQNNSGCIEISQIVFPPKQRTSIYSSKTFDKKKRRKFADWYLCVLKEGTSVFATSAVQADNDGFVRFRDEITFNQLSSDFEIDVALYSMRIRSQKQDLSHETKYHIPNNTTLCPLSPSRFFSSNKQFKSITQGNCMDQKSSYMLAGQFSLKINNIGHFGHFKMSHLNLPTLEGNFIMDFETCVNVNETYSGFLDVGLENGETITWNRRWCTLTEGSLKYFNYPGEENPLGFIDLYYCATAAISTADRQICARPRTLLVEVFNNSDDVSKPLSIIKYFLAADSKQYMDMWGNKLNSTVATLRTWNALKCVPSKFCY